jgi:hypothetical protein
MPKDLELLKEPKFKKTPKERKQEKAFGKDPTDLGLPTMGLIGMGATAASSAAYDKAKKLEKKHKKEAEKKTKIKIKQGKPKIAKKGWK